MDEGKIARTGYCLFRIHNSYALAPATPAPALAPGDQAATVIEEAAAPVPAEPDFTIPEPDAEARPATDP